MYKLKHFTAALLTVSGLFLSESVEAQCNTNISICTPGVAGPFNFNTPGTPVSSCLDFYGPSVSYITLHITQGGPLELLINGNATTGYIDVAIFNIPTGVAPCVAIQNTANEIGCNYAINAGGCNQFGTAFPCTSSVPAPWVNAGDELMIVVENWSGAAGTFTMELSPTGAQTGPPDPTISPMMPMSVSSPTVPMTAASSGGTWSASCGACIDSVTGMFNPSLAGPGAHNICYNIGSAPCDASDCELVVINMPLSVELDYAELNCENEQVQLQWRTLTELECDYFLVEKSRDGEVFTASAMIEGNGTTQQAQNYEHVELYDNESAYYRLTQFDYDGTSEILGVYAADCKRKSFELYPNPAEDKITVSMQNFDLTTVAIQVLDQTGRPVIAQDGTLSPEIEITLDALSPQLYTLIVRDDYTVRVERFSKL